ncbi:MAG TPA: UTP--glucose-1-phosphate uridylyltransferase [Sphingomicrobium sp.]|nr:UTP--glucose-1-phosphate uridylyltransferase [Sphingomicrobium sp.]
MTIRPVRKAVFPVAGLGTRLLPATKAIPKEMLTIVDRPLIQYAVDEAREAGIEEMVLVTGRGKSAIVDYFDVAFELEKAMKNAGKSLDPLAPSNARFGEIVTVRQQKPLGLGHAVWCARDIVGDEPFAVLLPDDLMVPGALKQMVESYEKLGGNIVLTEDVPRERTASYGIITPGETRDGAVEVKGLVEKPKPEDAPSNLGVIGRYILQPEVMQALTAQEPGAGGEVQLTDALAKLIGRQPFHAVTVDSVRHDCGDKTGFVLANVALGLADAEVGPRLRDFLSRA